MNHLLYYLVVALGAALSCLVVVRALQKPFFRLASAAAKQLDLIFDDTLKEDQKDRLILGNLWELVRSLVLNLFLGCCSILLGVLVVYGYSAQFQPNPDYTSIYFWMSLSAGSLLPFIPVRPKKTDYNYWSELLHTLVLDHYSLGRYLFKREKNKVKPPTNPSFTVVTGLARAGTSALTHLVFDPDHFHSITYANMPFLMAPRIWRKFYHPKQAKQKERAHQDRVMFSHTSIEALEEYFFKVKTNDRFIGPAKMHLQEISQDTYKDYLIYQKLFQAPNKNTSYLAKNNNFILKYHALRQHNEVFKVLLVIREPLAHASSLLRQHLLFCKAQKADPFVLQYMNWLGHHEFGLNQKVFDFGNQTVFQCLDQLSINYWLEVWINYYTYAQTILKDPNIRVVHYQDLLNTPDELKKQLAEFLKIPLSTQPQPSYQPKYQASAPAALDSQLLDTATALYGELIK